MTELALHLVAESVEGRETACIPAATATVVGPHLAITAKHVIIDYKDRFGMTSDFKSIAGNIYAVMTMADNKNAVRPRSETT